MSRTHPSLIIDARPTGPSGPLAAAPVLGRPLLAHLVELAEAVGPERVTVHVRPEDREPLRSLLPADGCELRADPPPEGVPALRADRLYDGRRLRRALRRGADPESAAIWRLDSAAGLAGAPDELLRRRTFQPLGQYWALGPARALARWLRPTRVRPNALTLASGMLMLAAAGLIGLGSSGLAAALAMAVALVLDTADGHLARLQGTATDFGRWLDSNLDELGDMAVHAAAAWSSYRRDQAAGWLVLGMLYGMGKYLFFVGNATWEMERPLTPALPRPGGEGWIQARQLVHGMGHADIRWHAWIVLAALGWLEVELAAFAAYFPLRALAGAIRKAGQR